MFQLLERPYLGHTTERQIVRKRDIFVVLSNDITADCICGIHCLALDVFDLNIVHKLSREEK